MGLAALLVVFVICFAGLGVAAGDRAQRRTHFWLRLGGLTAVPVCFVILFALVPDGELGATMGLFCFMAIPALMFVPVVLYRTPRSSGPGDEGGGGGGGGPDHPPARPTPPRGGIPLPDAIQAMRRVRDHSPLTLREARPRRGTREPVRRPAPVRPQH